PPAPLRSRAVTVTQKGDPTFHLGVLAFGDSITNGGGELQWGVALQSWALWVARALGLPFTSYAVDGARAQDVVERQIPAFEARTAHPEARYELGCLYIGVNDVRAADWEPAGFERDYRAALAFLLERCEPVLTVTAPLDLGRPRAGGVRDLTAIVRRVAGDLGALVLDLGEFRGRNLVMADHVHPTALGQIAIAERALTVLEPAGLQIRVRPSTLIAFETTRRGRLRGDVTYAFRAAKGTVRALLSRLSAS
ncbi:MAG TPA: GDSL-type esterase/lipase family protein, partial [Thermoleophilaceae bacterium]